jgi:hypothetical protein
MQRDSRALHTRSTFAPTLSWLRQTIDHRVAGFAIETFKAGPLTGVSRVVLEYGGNQLDEGDSRRMLDAGGTHAGKGGSTAAAHRHVPSVIVKVTAPDWPDDPHGPDREPWFYSSLAPRLGLERPRIYFAGADPDTRCRIVVMEDLRDEYRLPPPAHHWSFEELRCVVRAYARLHQAGRACMDVADEPGALWQMALQQRAWRAEEIAALYDDLARQSIWARRIAIGQLAERTLAGQRSLAGRPGTLLHHDVFPPNIALPPDPGGEAVLLDWGMLGWGMAELDLAFLFMQPFGNTAGIDRSAVLDCYWERRSALGGSIPPTDERWALQRHADALWALSLIPVAHRAALHPFPNGSAERAYWDAMFGVLGEHLARLCE